MLAKPQSKMKKTQDKNMPEDVDSLWLIGTDPVNFDVTDASVNHDDYLYGPLSEEAKAEIRTQSTSSPKHSPLSR